jgi:hypothetical protein
VILGLTSGPVRSRPCEVAHVVDGHRIKTSSDHADRAQPYFDRRVDNHGVCYHESGGAVVVTSAPPYRNSRLVQSKEKGTHNRRPALYSPNLNTCRSNPVTRPAEGDRHEALAPDLLGSRRRPR